MRILLIIPTIASFHIFLKELAQQMIEKGIDVHCACSSNALWTNNVEKVSGLKVHHIPLPRGKNLLDHYKCSYQINALVSMLKPDIVHAHFSSAIFSTALAHKNFWPTTIGTFQGLSYSLASGYGALLLKWSEVWAASRMNEVWVLTKDDFDILQSDAPKAKIHQQKSPGFGCHIGHFNPQLVPFERCIELKRKLGIANDEFIFTFVGRQVHFKGFDLLVRAFMHLIQSDTKVRLMLIGDPDPLHHSGLTITETAIFQSTPQISNLGWQVNVRDYLAISDAVVFPSNREGVSVSLMESTAMGIPIITCDSRGCKDVVIDMMNGIILKERTVEDLIMAMQRMRSDNTLRNKLSAGALKMRSQFDRQLYIQEQIQIYTDLFQKEK
jgi:glycosyltransferase involved in cell wall biosynthesis